MISRPEIFSRSHQQTASSAPSWCWLFLPILIALIFRFTGFSWDDGFMLHPDERFLVQVMNAMVLPESLGQYLDPASSTYNPTNIGHSFFIYGTLPIVLTKSAGHFLGYDSPGQFLYLGRFFSVMIDALSVIMIWLVSTHLTLSLKMNRFFPLLAALFFALSVLPIQLAHFFTVDSFMSGFISAAYVCSLHGRGRYAGQWAIAAGVFMALALACKIQALFALPLVMGLLIHSAVFAKRITRDSVNSAALRPWNVTWKILVITFSFLLSVYLCLRIVEPYYFQNASFFDIRLNEKWLSSIRTLLQLSGPDVWFPPAIQWIPTPPIMFALSNMAKFGLGPMQFLLAMIGVGLWLYRDRHPLTLMIVIWGALLFLYQSIQFTKALRYFILLYPWMAVLGAYTMTWVMEKGAALAQQRKGVLFRSSWCTKLVNLLFLLTVLAWPLLFLNVYIQPHTRVIASQWIYDNIPDKSKILYEYWDDPLPLRVEKTSHKRFLHEKLEVFAKDSEAKMATIREAMGKADYYILSSNRAWGSIPKVPWKYPAMSRFYDDLFAGRLGYEKVAEFVRHPSLEWLGLPLSVNDEEADETFTVYDHPKVIIMQRK